MRENLMDKNLRRWCLSICTVLMIMIAFNAHASFSYGARATGMGGAFTGLADDGSVVYWNPGSLSLLSGWVVELQYGSDSVFAEDTRDYIDYLRDSVNGQGSTLPDSVSKISDKDWLIKGGDSISLVIGNRTSAFHFRQYDMMYMQPGDDEELTDYELTGIQIKEYGLTFCLAGGTGGFSIGVTGKYIDADVYHAKPALWQIPSSDAGDLFDYLKDNGSEASDDLWGLDAGLSMVFGTSRLGFTARNIIDYEIEIDEDTKIKVEPEYRLGYAYMPARQFVLSVDYSIGKEKDLLGNDLEGSELATGFEAGFGDQQWLILRGGVSMPFESDAPMIFSIGGGLNFQKAILDIGYATDQDQDSEKLWGGLRFYF